MTREELIELMARAAAPDAFEWLDERPDIEEWQELAEIQRDRVRRSLDALASAGLAVVPKVPTDEMSAACLRLPRSKPLLTAAYAAMVEVGDVSRKGGQK